MAKRTKAPVGAEEPRVEESKAKSVKSRDAVTLEVKNQKHYGVPVGFTRTFSIADHGDDFEVIAAEWAAQFGAEEVN